VLRIEIVVCVSLADSCADPEAPGGRLMHGRVSVKVLPFILPYPLPSLRNRRNDAGVSIVAAS
jgi:hypothetical protein